MPSAEDMAESFEAGTADDQKLMGGSGGKMRKFQRSLLNTFRQAPNQGRTRPKASGPRRSIEEGGFFDRFGRKR